MAVSGIVFNERFTCHVDGSADSGVIDFSPEAGFRWNPEQTLATGTTAWSFDDFMQDTSRSLLSGFNDDIDLSQAFPGAGSNVNIVGQPLVCAEIIGLWIFNRKSSAGNLIIGGAGANAWTAPFNGSTTATAGPIQPGGKWSVFNPQDPAMPVSGTNKLLRINAPLGNVTFDIYAAIRRT